MVVVMCDAGRAGYSGVCGEVECCVCLGGGEHGEAFAAGGVGYRRVGNVWVWARAVYACACGGERVGRDEEGVRR